MAGVLIGLSNVNYALLTNDPNSGTATYGSVTALKGAITASINPNSSVDTLFADDGPYDTATTLGKIQLDLTVADLDLATQAALLGHTLNGSGVLIRKATDVPPWIAIGFKSLKSNGKYRYTWLAKGKFSLPQQDTETKADKIKFQNPKVTGNFTVRICDGEWERHIDEDSSGYTASQGTNWFNSPYGS